MIRNELPQTYIKSLINFRNLDDIIVVRGTQRNIKIEGGFNPKIIYIIKRLTQNYIPLLILLFFIFFHFNRIDLLILKVSHDTSYFKMFYFILISFDISNNP
jgi:hypothetical protein